MAGRTTTGSLAPEFSTDDLEGRIRALQIQSVLRQTPATMLANLLSAGVMLALFREHPAHGYLVAWTGLVAIAATLGVWPWLRSRRETHEVARQRRTSPRAIRLATRHASLVALLWASPPIVLAPLATPEQKLVLAAISTGMLCAGGFALSTIRSAGTAYALIISAGCAIALLRADLSLGLPLAVLLAIGAAIVVICVRNAADTFRARIEAELKTEQQNQVISLLLRDFEKSTADVLWETNELAELQNVSERFAEQVGRPQASLEGASLPGLFLELQQGLAPSWQKVATEALDRFGDALRQGLPFRDLDLLLQVQGRHLWWSLCAKPLPGAQGRFGWRGVATDVSTSRQAQQKIFELAMYDVVTGLPNRHHFREELERTMDALAISRGRFAVLILDLDGFKNINDSFGHDVGDRLLKFVGQRLTQVKRHTDLVARIGGDEFGVILREADSRVAAEGVARRLLDCLERAFDIDGTKASVGACIGIALAPDDCADAESLIKHADLALYAAKAAGARQLRCYTEDMKTKVMQRVAIEHALQDAVANGQLHLMFQPQICVETGALKGFEALARWNHPTLGEVPPSLFIPIAEEAGLILDIGGWVLREACRVASTWPVGVSVAINLSPLQLKSSTLCDEVAQAMSLAQLPSSQLELEVTESVLLEDDNDTVAQLHGLRDLGLRVALDDFGTGYSAMAYLRRFPFDKLKIDRSFVQEISTQPDSRAIVKAIVDVAHALRMQTVAEGVEVYAEVEILRAQGCDQIQGYLVSKPLPAASVQAFIEHYDPFSAMRGVTAQAW